MTFDAWILVAIIVFAIAAFVREWMPMDVVALTSLGLCLVFDLVSPEEAIAGFGNTAVITVLMMFGVVVLLVSRSITIQQAYRAVDWTVIFLLAGILPLGIAMQNTGLARVIADLIQPLGLSYPPFVLLSLMYLATTLLTSIFSNNATAVLMVPIAIGVASDMQVDPKPFLMAVTYAASASFMTPMGYQTNAMVFGPGNYRFVDYLKFGAPLTVILWLAASLLIPVIWPLRPA